MSQNLNERKRNIATEINKNNGVGVLYKVTTNMVNGLKMACPILFKKFCAPLSVLRLRERTLKPCSYN